MPLKDKKLPLLKAFSHSRAGKGTVLTSPTTSLWLAIIFVALIFALGSIQRTVSKAEEEANSKNIVRSGFLSDAPEKEPEFQPPPNPDLFTFREQEAEEIVLEAIPFEKEVEPIELKPIDVNIQLEMPEALKGMGKSSSAE